MQVDHQPEFFAIDSSELQIRFDNRSAEDLRAVIRDLSPAPSLSGIYCVYSRNTERHLRDAPSLLSRPTSVNSDLEAYTQYLPFGLPNQAEDVRYSVYDDDDEIRGVQDFEAFQNDSRPDLETLSGASDETVVAESEETASTSSATDPPSGALLDQQADPNDLPLRPLRSVIRLVRGRSFSISSQSTSLRRIIRRIPGTNLMMSPMPDFENITEIIPVEESPNPRPTFSLRSSVSMVSLKQKFMNALQVGTGPRSARLTSPSVFSLISRRFSFRKARVAEPDFVSEASLRPNRASLMNRNSMLRRTASFSGYSNFDFIIDRDHGRLIQNALRWAEEDTE
ncbi:hypothetical protein CVT26_006884 [Gymnopilus dilepis]|uniref:Uncharacterized protein n=1 Tax=Gymnopilus dilepis TaxID=231916 RepID=A0A409W0T0_9AGAR|nr:hypothetical protein CVT26_006884 [Gymnopilus dilepis]